MLRRSFPTVVFLVLAVITGLFILYPTEFSSFVEGAVDDLLLTVRRIMGRAGAAP